MPFVILNEGERSRRVCCRDFSRCSKWQERLFVFLIHTFCFFCSVCRIVCVSVDIWLNIRGYFITYPWIFHYVSTVTRSFYFVFAVYWLYVFVFSHMMFLFCVRLEWLQLIHYLAIEEVDGACGVWGIAHAVGNHDNGATFFILFIKFWSFIYKYVYFPTKITNII